MCLNIFSDSYPKSSIAEEDIIVYKIVRTISEKEKTFKTFYRDQIVKLGKTYKAKIGIPRCSYDILYDFLNGEKKVDYFEIDQGLHSFKNKKDAKVFTEWDDFSVCILTCIIPKGSEYYEGEFGGYPCFVSNQLHYLDYVSWDSINYTSTFKNRR